MNPLTKKIHDYLSTEAASKPFHDLLALAEVLDLPTLDRRRAALTLWPDDRLDRAIEAQRRRQPECHAMDLLLAEDHGRIMARNRALSRWLDQGEIHFSTLAHKGLADHLKREGKVPTFPCSLEVGIRLITQEPDAPWPELQPLLVALDRQTRERFARGAILSEEPEFGPPPSEIQNAGHFGELSSALWPLCRKGKAEQDKKVASRARSTQALDEHRSEGATSTNQIKERKRMESVIAAYASYCETQRRLGLRDDNDDSIPDAFPKVTGVSNERARDLMGSFNTARKHSGAREDLIQLVKAGGWQNCTDQDILDCYQIFLETIRR